MYVRVPEENYLYYLDQEKLEQQEEEQEEQQEQQDQQQQESDIESSEMDTSMDSGTSGGGTGSGMPCQPQMIWIIRWVPLVKSVVSDMPCLQNCFICRQNDLKCLKFLDIPSKSLPSGLKNVRAFV